VASYQVAVPQTEEEDEKRRRKKSYKISMRVPLSMQQYTTKVLVTIISLLHNPLPVFLNAVTVISFK
jgi:hypothetical protein